ncbi:MAG: ABC-2 type transport system ATP-binding protein [Myxococcota bacterium]|jgi:ABC-2 type transport system ATP-binding protein
MIEVRDLSKSYDGFEALKGISFAVEQGEIVGFLGPNGAGKSTTMKILTCFMPQTAGQVTIGGHDVNDAPVAVRRLIGYLPESTALYTDMLVYDYLAHVAALRGVAKSMRPERIRAVAQMCGIVDRLGQRIATLSKGYRQRVGLAQALIHDPRILILDEPTSGLDPNQIVEIRNLIKRLGEDRTIILSTHNLPEVRATCSRMIIVHNGRIVADGSAAELEHRQSDTTRLQVTVSGPSPEDAATELRALPGVDDVRALPTDEPGACSVEVVTAASTDVRAEIFQLAVAKGWSLLGLERMTTDLETLFRQLTQEV